MARLESSENAYQSLKQEKLDAEVLSSTLQSELKLCLSKQNHLLKIIRKLEIEVFETNLEGISTLFDITHQNLEREDLVVTKESKNIVPNLTKCIEQKSQTILPSSHFKDRVFHENLVNSIENIIERHYKNKGFGKFYGGFQKKFPDACHIM